MSGQGRGRGPALSWLWDLERFGTKLGLENIAQLLEGLGHPEERFPAVHVAGSNGKGSVCAMLASILQAAGLRVGLYTSPHLSRLNERIQINGEPIADDLLERRAAEVQACALRVISPDHQITFFEATTALALSHFAQEGVDLAVVEVGMGGRLDATNLVHPLLAVITRVALEHTQYLGTTLEAIAQEKAGIIKPRVPLVCGARAPEARAVIRATAERAAAPQWWMDEGFSASGTADWQGIRFSAQAPTWAVEGLRCPLHGRYQLENAAMVFAAIAWLRALGWKISETAVRNGFAATRWPGRLEVVREKSPLIIDGSHNPDGAAATAAALRDLGVSGLTAVFACLGDKEVRGILEPFRDLATDVLITQVRDRRALPAERLAEVGREIWPTCRVVPVAEEAFELAARSGTPVLITGSLYLAGLARDWWNAQRRRGPNANA